MAYKLDLPGSSQVHPVVHVSQLKRQVPPQTQVHTSLNLMSTDPAFALVPAQILRKTMVPSGAGKATRIQVHWSDAAPQLVTWEDPEALCRNYPTAPAWGQAVLRRGE